MTEMNFCLNCQQFVYGNFCYNCNEIVTQYDDEYLELDENESE